MLSYYTSSEYESSSSSVGASNSGNGSSGGAQNGSGAGVIAEEQKLTREDIRECKRQALRTVKVPQSVIQLLTDLRSHLQEKFEPPVYVSDRRLVKSIQLLQVRMLRGDMTFGRQAVDNREPTQSNNTCSSAQELVCPCLADKEQSLAGIIRSSFTVLSSSSSSCLEFSAVRSVGCGVFCPAG